MARRISARDARAHFAELTDEVRYTGEPVIVEKQGRAFVAVISIDDLERLERFRKESPRQTLTLGKDEATKEYYLRPEPEDEEIVQEVKRTREELFRERYGGE
jgi:prevent-host-death family protein